MVPLQSSLTVTLPACQDAPSGHNPFPGVQPTIVSFEDRVRTCRILFRNVSAFHLCIFYMYDCHGIVLYTAVCLCLIG